MPYDYLKDPAAIYRQSFALVRAAVDLDPIAPEMHPLALRLVHATGEPSLLNDLGWSAGAATVGQVALASGATIIADAQMVAHGIIRRRLKANRIVCTIDESAVTNLAKKIGNTRSAAAVELWKPHMAGAVIAIGNAPTALFHLLELLAAGAPRPALILAFPVGFVGATEAKQALIENSHGVPFITLVGRRGGSAIAAAAVNALLTPQEDEEA